MNPNRDEFDRLLDEGLAAYGNQDPLEGLEDRVLRRVLAEPAPRGLWRLAWWTAIPAAACLAALVLWTGLSTSPKEVPPLVVARQAPKMASPPVAAPQIQRVEKRKPARSKRTPALPKLEQFPAARPLTEEERFLLSFVSKGDVRMLEPLFARVNPGGEPPPITVEELKTPN